MITYLDVILALRPSAQVALVGGDTYAHIDWGQETPIPQAELDAALSSVSLSLAKVNKRAQINAARDDEEAGGFSYLGKRFDSDAQAIKRLYGAAMAAQAAIAGGMPPSATMVTWTTADGTTIDLTYADAAAVPVAMAQVAGALHAKVRTLKAQVEAAATVDEVNAIQW